MIDVIAGIVGGVSVTLAVAVTIALLASIIIGVPGIHKDERDHH